MKRGHSLLVVGLAMGITAAQLAAQAASDPAVDHKTAEKCSVCHTKLQTASGQPASIEQDWSASAMANAARDPYWQGSVRRETVEHPEIAPAIENECASCHMPLQHLRDQEAGHEADATCDRHRMVGLGADGVVGAGGLVASGLCNGLGALLGGREGRADPVADCLRVLRGLRADVADGGLGLRQEGPEAGVRAIAV